VQYLAPPPGDLLEQALNEGIAQPVVLARIEEERKEVRVTKLLAQDADCLEDVELLREPFQRFQVGVLDHEPFQRLPVSKSHVNLGFGSSGHGQALCRLQIAVGLNHPSSPV
jgi:hypothetical protein